MSSRKIVLLRTHVSNAAIVSQARRIRDEAGYDVIFVADESTAPLAVPKEFAKVSVTAAAIDGLGVYAPPDVAWRCGDYAFYLARDLLEGARIVWQIEYDVLLRCANLKTFFGAFDRRRMDFLAPYFARRGPDWCWQPLMAPFTSRVFGCLFPVTRLSLRLIDFLFAARRALSSARDWAQSPAEYPNDESFAASTAVAGGFACADLAQCRPGVYTPTSFPPNAIPIPRRFVESRRSSAIIYHPVYAGRMFDGKLRDYRRRADPDDHESARRLAGYLAAVARD
jgi:hypothetical protein